MFVGLFSNLLSTDAHCVIIILVCTILSILHKAASPHSPSTLADMHVLVVLECKKHGSVCRYDCI